MIFNVISRALTAATPGALASAATSIGRLTGRSVSASASSILGAIKGWAMNNPTKAMLAANALAFVGIDIAVDELADLLQEQRKVIPGLDALVDEVRATVERQRQDHVGDGTVDTYHGMRQDEYLQSVAHQKAMNEIVYNGVRAAGSLASLKAIRKAVFLEDIDFDVYEQTSVAWR